MKNLKRIKTPCLNVGTAEELRERVRDYFHKSFSIEEQLYEILTDSEVFYLRPDPLRHPVIFYLGHTAAFYINKLNIAGIINERINPSFESIFAVGVDEMSWDDLNEAHYDWPEVDAVKTYREQVRTLVDKVISTLPAPEGGIDWDSPWWAIVMCAEHQRIHLETTSVLIRQLPLDKVRELGAWEICREDGRPPENQLLPVPGGKVVLGKAFSDPFYGWDNEYGSKEIAVEEFKASKYLVSNREYLGFVEAGGYLEESFWTPEGWQWNTFEQAGMPRFWRKRESGDYVLRTITTEIPMPWSHPVEINYLEAKAFCNWKAKTSGKKIRMPTEAEWYRLRDLHLDTDQPFWDKAPGNINLEYYSSACPVDRFAFDEFFDLIGNVWQWTETPISAFPGFKTHPFYDDFSVPTFDTRHNLIKGGSFISTGNEALRASRYAFRRHFYQHAGFRYIESAVEPVIEDNLYENDPQIVPFCDLDWDGEFAKDLLKKLDKQGLDLSGKNVLHLGCKTGRLSFELAGLAAQVTGLDFSARTIRLATHIKEGGYIRYSRIDEGEIPQTVERSLKDYDLQDFADKVEFWQADSSNLLPKFTGYDVVVAINTVEEARKPNSFLQEIPKRIKSGGYLVLADSYHFVGTDAPAGIRKDGEPYRGLDWLKDELSDSFRLVHAPQNIWQKLRKDSRNFDARLLEMSIWKKKS